jgi:uncharacterized membrane protein YqaE (UPF0057 family)
LNMPTSACLAVSEMGGAGIRAFIITMLLPLLGYLVAS